LNMEKPILLDKKGVLTPVKTVRKSAIVAEKIKALILENKYDQGEKLPSESELGRLLSVSRASIREAFRALELMGLIEVKSGSGTYVKNTDIFNLSKLSNSSLSRLENEASTMLEILEARRIFEINIVGLSAENATPEDLNGMKEILTQMEASLGDEEAFKDADLRFHSEVARLTKNRVIEALANSIYQILRDKFPMTYSIVSNNSKLANRILNLHLQVFEALRAQDSKKAKAYMTQHINLAYKISKDYLEHLRETEVVPLEENEGVNQILKRKEKGNGNV
jgi:GntR family transcriptional regulator, transcriptional repressor for pyruvate dehydrogenase complex